MPPHKPKLPPNFKSFKAQKGGQFQGFDFKKINNKLGKHGYSIFFTLQTIGCLGLLISGAIDGNEGRMKTGIGNTSKNFLGVLNEKDIGIFKKFDKEVMRDVLLATSFATNLPQLSSAIQLPNITTAEIIASVAVVSAYAILATPGAVKLVKKSAKTVKNIKDNNKIFKNHKIKTKSKSRPQGAHIIQRKARKLSEKFNKSAVKVSSFMIIFLAPTLLWLRAGAQLTDGVIRQDPAAIAAGTCFILAPIALSMANQFKAEISKEITNEPLSTVKENTIKIQSGDIIKIPSVKIPTIQTSKMTT